MLWWLAQNALVAAALAGAVAVACRLLRPAPALCHALWVVVLLKLLTPPGLPWTWTLPDAAWHNWLSARVAAPAAARPAPAPAVPAAPAPAIAPRPGGAAPASPAPESTQPVERVFAQVPPEPELPPAPEPIVILAPIAPAVGGAEELPVPGVPLAEKLVRGAEAAWLTSAAVVALWHLRRLRRLRMLASWGAPAPPWLERQTADFAAQLGIRPPRVLVLPGCGSPFLWCLGRPVLLVPSKLLHSLPAECWPGLLVHELAHLRRRDHWVSWLMLPAACLWWWNPLFWLVQRRVNLNAELACDAWVIGTLPDGRRPFAEALIEVSRLISLPAAPAPALGMGAADRHAFERRLTMILHDRARHRLTAPGLLAVGLFAVAALPCWAPGQPPAPGDKEKGAMMKPLPPEEALAKARVNGKYAMLLRQFKAEADAAQYQAFRDAGMRDVRSHAGQDDLPKGHWVYVYPNWYIWRDLASAPRPSRNWGPEQAIGEPDTMMAGDIVTAWASRTPDAQDEWLMTEYAEPVVPRAVIVHETYNPGAVIRVTVFKLDGTEVEVWKGKDPTPPDEPSGMGVSIIPIKVDFKTNRVKIYIDSQAVPGWNEIDAVGLRDAGGKTQWASSVAASTTYAEQEAVAVAPPEAVMVPAEMLQRLMRLERDVRDLKKQNQELVDELRRLREQMKDKKNP